jgi:signal transduction histidine kinase
LRLQLEAWAGRFDPAMQRASFWGPPLAISSVATFAIIGFVCAVPGVREFFGLRPAVPLALVVARLLIYFAFERYERVRGGGTVYFALATLFMGFAFQLVASSLVVFSEPPGAFVFAVVPVVGASYNCMVMRATPLFPWPALAHGFAMAIVLALRPGSPQIEIFSVAGPLAVGSGLFLGMLGTSMANARETLEEHRRAIEAHALEERTGEARRLSSSLLELLQRSHDASSAISAALLDADQLTHLVRRDGGPCSAPVGAAAASLRSSLERVGLILGAEVEATGEREAERNAAPVVPAVRAALAQVARRFPAVRLEIGAVSRGPEPLDVALKDGAGGLEQLIAELVKNACEGSGTQRARRVTVSVDAVSEPGSIAIRVLDDGPGFAPHVLVGAPTAFVTTKPGGTGLGLYTAERLAAANGGSLHLENPPGGGSAVTLRLRRV